MWANGMEANGTGLHETAALRTAPVTQPTHAGHHAGHQLRTPFNKIKRAEQTLIHIYIYKYTYIYILRNA